MIRAVCWDVGGVFTGSPHGAIAEVAAEHSLSAEALSEAVFGALDGSEPHPWHELERGHRSLRDAWADIDQRLRSLGVELSMRDLFGRMGADPVDRTCVHGLVAEFAAAGVTQAVITNNVREFSDLGDGRGWQRLVPLDAMAVVVDSSAVGLRKPDAAIYRHLLAELDVAPHEAVLVDDTEVNLQGAAAVGMAAVHVGIDPAPAMAELRAMVLS